MGLRRILIAGGAVAAVFATTACGAGTNPDGDGANVVEPGAEDTTATAEEGGDEDEAPAGTRENPLDPGVPFAVGDWTVQLDTTNLDANEAIAAENPYNDPPAEGRQFVMVEVTVTYTGDESGTPWFDLTIDFYGSGGNTFGGADLDDYCGVIPSPLDEVGEMFPEASATGNVCVSVPADQVDDGAWIVENLWALDSDRTFVAVD